MAIAMEKLYVTVEFLGDKTTTRSKVFEIFADDGLADDAARYAAAVDWVNVSLLPTLALLTDAEIVGYTLSGAHVEQTTLTTPVDAPIYEEAVLTYRLNASGTKKATLAIPAPVDTLFVGGSKNNRQIDFTAAPATTLGGLFTAGSDGRVSDGETIDTNNAAIAGRLRSVKSGQTF